MKHEPLTADEIEVTRRWLSEPVSNGLSDLIKASALSPRLLATVDALTERVERAEAEVKHVMQLLISPVEVMKARFIDERDEALALADARGRALESILTHATKTESIKLALSLVEDAVLDAAREALALTAPEALRQQQEREAEKDALIEALIDEVKDADSKLFTDISAAHHHLIRALSLTPPQALRERKERVATLEKVAETARLIVEEWLNDATPDKARYVLLAGDLAALDTKKRGRETEKDAIDE